MTIDQFVRLFVQNSPAQATVTSDFDIFFLLDSSKKLNKPNLGPLFFGEQKKMNCNNSTVSVRIRPLHCAKCWKCIKWWKKKSINLMKVPQLHAPFNNHHRNEREREKTTNGKWKFNFITFWNDAIGSVMRESVCVCGVRRLIYMKPVVHRYFGNHKIISFHHQSFSVEIFFLSVSSLPSVCVIVGRGATRK